MRKNCALIVLLFSILTCHAQAEVPAPVEFDLLLIIKPTGSIPELDYSYTMTEEDIAAATKSYLEYFPALVTKLSKGTVKVNTTVKVSSRPVTTLSTINNSYWLSPGDAKEDVKEFTEIGQYDCVQTYYCLTGIGGDIMWGLGSYDFFEEVNYAGYSAIVYRESFSTPEYLNPDSYAHEIWLHEWMHSLEGFYYNVLGVRRPPHPAHLDAAEKLGYTSDIIEDSVCVNNLPIFYSHHLLGKFIDFTHPLRPTIDGGFGPEAWKYGTPKQYYKKKYADLD